MTTTETYRLSAVRYATRDAKRSDHFLGGDPDPEQPMPMDYFVWVATNAQRTIVIDTGFSASTAAKRGRIHLRQPAAGLRLLGVDASQVEDVIITHLHYDHVGTIGDFPRARLHLQEKDLHFVTGQAMTEAVRRASYEVDDVLNVVRALHTDRVRLYDGPAEVAPGLSLHLLGGHTPGMQAVRVHTARGWVVVASDATHYYENMESRRPFATTYDPAQVLAGFTTLRELADSPRHIIPGHDPLVMRRYAPPSPELDGIAVRLDVPPT